jgi:HAD superfamily hydrolase (TIGR01509 family)
MTSGNLNIRALIFDFIGVLLEQRNDYIPDRTVDSVDALIGHVVDDSRFKETVRSDYSLQEQAFHNILAKIADKYTPFRPLWDLLPELRRSYKLAVINNGTSLPLPLFNTRFGINYKFDAFICSAAEGIRKPDARIYLHTCGVLGVSPEQCLFMDDAEENVAGARCAGMQAMHWKSHTEGYQLLLRVLANKDGRI